jgi:hypothetical protein
MLMEWKDFELYYKDGDSEIPPSKRLLDQTTGLFKQFDNQNMKDENVENFFNQNFSQETISVSPTELFQVEDSMMPKDGYENTANVIEITDDDKDDRCVVVSKDPIIQES